MDLAAHRTANFLVGNRDEDATVEIPYGGFSARFLCGARIAVAGVEPVWELNGTSLPQSVCVPVRAGDVLAVGRPRVGVYVYLAVSGGVDVPMVMGSRSTFLRGGFGGFAGRSLKRGDIVPLGEETGPPPQSFPPEIVPPYSDHPVLRIISGPQVERLTSGGMETLLSASYSVSERSDRMGCILSGPAIELLRGADIVSDGTCPGAIQISGDGRPTLLMADCQTAGGYVKPTWVITADLPLAAQLRPGSTVRFRAVDLVEARESFLKTDFRFRRI